MIDPCPLAVTSLALSEASTRESVPKKGAVLREKGWSFLTNAFMKISPEVQSPEHSVQTAIIREHSKFSDFSLY